MSSTTDPRRTRYGILAILLAALSLLAAGPVDASSAPLPSPVPTGSAQRAPRLPEPGRLGPMDSRSAFGGSAAARSRRPATPRYGSVAPVAGTPTAVALDKATDTVYAVSDDLDKTTDAGQLFVLDTRTCRVGREHCRPPVASVDLGRGTYDLVLDPAGTLYVVEGDDHRIAVLDVRSCTARTTSGCGAPVARIDLDDTTYGVGLDRTRHTLFVTTAATVAVVDTASCNARIQSGCSPVTTIPVGRVSFLDVESSTSTLYLPSGSNGVAVVDLKTCNSTATAGCAKPQASIPVDGYLSQAQLDPRTNTLYAVAYGTVFVVDTAHCRSGDLSGCATAAVGSTPGTPVSYRLELDSTARIAYVSSPGYFDAVGAVDLRRCSARDLSGCVGRPEAQQAISSTYGLARAGRSIYVTNYQTRGIQVLDARACTPTHTAGCRKEAPTIPGAGFATVFDPGNQVLYTNVYDTTIGVYDTRTCNLRRLASCPQDLPTIDSGFQADGLGIDPGTHTLYARASRPADPADPGGVQINEIQVVDTRRCAPGVADASCVPVASIPVDGDVDSFDVDPRSHTVYVTLFTEVTGESPGKIAVVHGDHCNAEDHDGCAEPIRYVQVGDNVRGVNVSTATDTVYVEGQADGAPAGVLSLLPTTACDRGGDGSACEVVATTPIGADPVAGSEDAAHHTLYVTSQRDNALSVVDTAACNASHTGGCARHWVSAPAGNVAFGVTYAPQSRIAYVLNAFNATVSLIDTRRCNATDTRGCGRVSPTIAVGAFTDVARADPASDTLFVNNAAEGTISLVGLRHPCASGLCVRPR